MTFWRYLALLVLLTGTGSAAVPALAEAHLSEITFYVY